jgi:predicted secreted protein
MDSTDAAKEYIAGMSDAGEITFTVNYDGSAAGTANTLQTSFAARTAEVWTIAYPDTSTDAASGFITALGKTTPLNDRISQDVTIKLTGVVTYTDVA